MSFCIVLGPELVESWKAYSLLLSFVNNIYVPKLLCCFIYYITNRKKERAPTQGSTAGGHLPHNRGPKEALPVPPPSTEDVLWRWPLSRTRSPHGETAHMERGLQRNVPANGATPLLPSILSRSALLLAWKCNLYSPSREERQHDWLDLVNMMLKRNNYCFTVTAGNILKTK